MQASSTERSLLFRSLLKGTALYSIALFGQRLGSIILLPINTRFLNPADYGVLELAEQSMMVASILLGIQLSASLGYFYFETDSQVVRDRVASTSIIGAVLVGILAAVVPWSYYPAGFRPGRLAGPFFGGIRLFTFSLRA